MSLAYPLVCDVSCVATSFLSDYVYNVRMSGSRVVAIPYSVTNDSFRRCWMEAAASVSAITQLFYNTGLIL